MTFLPIFTKSANTFAVACHFGKCAFSFPLLSLQLLKNKAYMILLACFGSGIGIFTCFSTLLEQILFVKGYTNVSQNLH